MVASLLPRMPGPLWPQTLPLPPSFCLKCASPGRSLLLTQGLCSDANFLERASLTTSKTTAPTRPTPAPRRLCPMAPDTPRPPLPWCPTTHRDVLLEDRDFSTAVSSTFPLPRTVPTTWRLLVCYSLSERSCLPERGGHRGPLEQACAPPPATWPFPESSGSILLASVRNPHH